MAEFTKQIENYFRTAPNGTRLCWGAKSMLAHRMEARIELRKHFFHAPDVTKPPVLDERNPPLVHADVMNRPLVMVGHQPLLFHPGVWMKNFVAARLAQRVGGKAVNLIVDNDVMKTASITVPSRIDEGVIAQVAFDALSEEMPYEERKVIDAVLADSFATRVQETMPEVNWTPLLQKIWEMTGRHALKVFMKRSEKARDEKSPAYLRKELSVLNYFRSQLPNFTLNFYWRDEFSSLRGHWESVHGYQLDDICLSGAISNQAFARLALEIIHDARPFAEIYNACLTEYREVHGLRSRSHPAPDLEIVTENEIELPFWLWIGNSPHRRRAFVRRNGHEFTITDGKKIEWSANFKEGEKLLGKIVAELLSPTDDPNRPKLRPKALITTLYARLLLCDGFVHGIGGAKYDQVTEAIAARWGLGTLAPMQCATMTLRLPLPMEIISEDEVRSRKRKLRDLIYHPERFISEAELSVQQRERASVLASEKQQWIARQSPEELRDRHRQIQTINAELTEMLGALRQRFEEEYFAAQSKFAAQQPWLSREFAAVLFPEEMLKAEFARVISE